jgi:tRNA-dihydrouridine synthase 2
MADGVEATMPDPVDEPPWEYRGAWVLAPMVRVNTLPFRLLCAEHGADMLYSEELVDKSVSACRRSVSARGEAEYRHADGKLIFSTVPHERVAFQLGTASGPDALAAANLVADDVRAIDVNMGCPVKFSTQGGMGSALLREPERVCDILSTLVRNFGGRRPITCKIRILESPAATLQLARVIESCGVDAIAVHCRRVPDRPRHWAQWDAMTELRLALPQSLPLLLNGDIFSPPDGQRALDQTGADGLMLARGAIWNPALFARDEARPVSQVSVGFTSYSIAPLFNIMPCRKGRKDSLCRAAGG